MKKIKLTSLLMLFVLLGAFSVFAQTTLPEAPTQFDVEERHRRDTSAPGQELDVIAGNITALTVHGLTTTQSWAGVYGNITGTLVLSNGGNEVMYDWAVANPKGEIFATTANPAEETIYWDELQCYDLSLDDVEHGFQYYTLDRFHADLGINATTDEDAINKTFDSTVHEPFYVATQQFTNCPKTSLYNASQEKDEDIFQQVLLYNANGFDDTVFVGQDHLENQSVIFTSLIEYDDVRGFNNQFMDFQMLLAENGRNGNTAATTYYFYVELE